MKFEAHQLNLKERISVFKLCSPTNPVDTEDFSAKLTEQKLGVFMIQKSD